MFHRKVGSTAMTLTCERMDSLEDGCDAAPSKVSREDSCGYISSSVNAGVDSGNHGYIRSFSWRDVKCSYNTVQTQSSSSLGIEVLHGISGHLRQGQMLAILGHSGSGKTCLLDILAGRKSVGHVSGTRVMDGIEVPHAGSAAAAFKKQTAYVAQTDVFHPTCTVKEAVMFQAHLRLDRRLGRPVKESLALKLIDEVGLGGKEDQYVGGPLPGGLDVRGLSGGEKRRLSLCCATVTAPTLLFLDEPTSGLDSFSALVVVRLLKKYCDRGMMILCTIHQPRSAVWSLFEKVMVLSMGHELFFGWARDVEAWFSEGLGYSRRPDTSVGDWVLDLVNVGFSKEEEVFGPLTMRSREDVEAAAARFHASYRAKTVDEESMRGESDMSSITTAMEWGSVLEGVCIWCWQFRVLLARNFRSCIRNPGNALARLIVMVVVACLQGLVYYQIGVTEGAGRGPDRLFSGINIMGSLFYTLFCVSILPFASLSLFIYDRQFFAGEAAANLYPCSAYYLASMSLETVLHCINGTLFASIAYYMMDYPAFTQPSSVTLNFLTYLALVVIQLNIGNMVVQFCALLAPNQDIAFALAAGYSALVMLSSGYLVPFPHFWRCSRWLQWIAHLKFLLQAAAMNAMNGTPLEPMIKIFAFDHPRTITENMLSGFGIYALMFVGAYVCLRFLHKEQR